ncbi:MAG: 6-phosphogluconolactonase [Polyangia bacterium]
MKTTGHEGAHMNNDPAEVEVDIRSTPDAVIAAAAERLITAAAVAIAAAGRFVLALSGGATPRALYALLATPPYAARLDWTRVQAFWGDERCLPPDHADSNYRMARETLLDHVPILPANVHRVRGEDPPAEAAAAYERELRATFSQTAWPRFDLVLLGMGDNGHTASLFPGLTAVREATRWAVAEYVAAVSMWRVTLTPPVLNGAAEVLFVATGQEKAQTLRRVLEGPLLPDQLPAQVVRPPRGRVTWLVDAAAAAHLTLARRGHEVTT